MVKIRHGLASLNSITLLIMVRNIKYGYSFFFLERAEHFETKIEQIWRNFLFCNKTASSTATPCKKCC